MDKRAVNRLKARIWNIINYQRKRELNRKWREEHPDYWRLYLARKRIENPTWYKLYITRNYPKKRIRIVNNEINERILKLRQLRLRLSGETKEVPEEWHHSGEEGGEAHEEPGE